MAAIVAKVSHGEAPICLWDLPRIVARIRAEQRDSVAIERARKLGLLLTP
jgi:hypothetical protein